MTLHTRVCDILGIEVAVLQAGMANHTNADLVAAVSNAGGLGILGGVDRTPQELLSEVARVRELTERPFGINMVIAECTPAQWEACFSAAPQVLNTSWGNPAGIVEPAHAAGCRVVHQVNTVSGAEVAVRAGVDVIIAQGSEGGGHVGSVSTMALVPQFVDAAAGIPVVAAGGIADGRGFAAALVLGAEGILVGTRFLASDEAPIADGWKQALLANPAECAVISPVPDLMWDVAWPGASCRVLRNRLIEEWDGQHERLIAHAHEVAAQVRAAQARNDISFVPLYAGQSVGLLHKILPAAEIVRAFVAEAEAALVERGRLAGPTAI